MSRKALLSTRWKRLRRFILERDGYRCRECGRAGRLEVDHVLPVAHGGAEWDASGLQALCRSCHKAKTRREHSRAPNPEREAWRAYLER